MGKTGTRWMVSSNAMLRSIIETTVSDVFIGDLSEYKYVRISDDKL